MILRAIVALLIGTALACGIALVSGLMWWGQCLLYAKGREPSFCHFLGPGLLLLWIACVGGSWMVIMRFRENG